MLPLTRRLWRRSITDMGIVTAPRIPPPAVAAGALLAQYLLTRPAPGGIVRRAFAVGLLGAGVTLGALSERRFRAARTTVNPLHPERGTQLVADGPYAISRNPMYLGLVCSVAAHGLWRGGLLAQVPTALLAEWLDRAQIPAEEQALRSLHGRSYVEYCRRVPRWISSGCANIPCGAEADR